MGEKKSPSDAYVVRSSLPTAELCLNVLARSAVPFLYFNRSLYITLWHNSIAFRWLWVLNMLQEQKKKATKKSLLWVFLFVFLFFFFFFVMQPNQKKVLPVVRDSNLQKYSHG